MVTFFLAITALIPIVLAPFVILKPMLPQKDAMPMICVITAVLAASVWRVELSQIAAGALQGLWVAYELCFTIFMGFIFQQIFRQSRCGAAIRDGLKSISPDRRIQALIVAYFMCSGIEGMIGFSISGGMCMLVLAGMGFPPTAAYMMCLMGPMTASAFNGMGTPVFFGIHHALQDPLFADMLKASGHTEASYLKLVSAQAAIIHAMVGIFQPAIMMLMFHRFYDPKRSWIAGLAIVPFAIFCGLAFCIPYALTAIYIGPEYPALVGSLVGIAIVLVAIRFKFLVPEHAWEFPEKWDNDWSAGKYKPEAPVSFSNWMGWMPYIVLGVLLILSRIPPIKTFLYNWTVEWHNVFGTYVSMVSHPFYMPCGLFLIIMTIVCTIAYKMNAKQIRAYAMPAIIPSSATLTKAPFCFVMAAIFMHTSINASGHPSMHQSIADLIAMIPFNKVWVTFFMPLMSGLGTILATNNTFCILMMGPLTYSVENTIHLPTGFLMALQVVGSSAGIMLSGRYLVSVGTVLGLLGWEPPMARKLIMPSLVLVFIMGIAAVLALFFFNMIEAYLPASYFNIQH